MKKFVIIDKILYIADILHELAAMHNTLSQDLTRQFKNMQSSKVDTFRLVASFGVGQN